MGPGAIAVALLLATIVSRLLGARLPIIRAVVIGIPAAGAGYFSGAFLAKQDPGHVSPFAIVVGIAVAVITTMLLMVLVELVARPERQLRSTLPHPWRALRRVVRDARRYGQLSRIAVRHGLPRASAASRADPSELGRRLRLTLEEAGPIFVKLGQVLSTRTDLLPQAVTAELAKLQDQVPPAPWSAVRALLDEELAMDPGQVFSYVDAEPLASASLAQAHSARLPDGSAVILKVQRPGVDDLVARDLDMVRRLTRTLESQAEWARAYHVADLGSGFADALAEELDFRVEARNIAAIAAAAPAGAPVRLPAVHADLSSRRLLVLERLEGVSVRDAGAELDEHGVDRAGLARELLGYLLRQILVEGTFHADPHPGNVLYLRTGQLGLVDFGSVGRLDIRQQNALQRLLLGVAMRDSSELSDAVRELAVVHISNEDRLEEALGAFMTQHLGKGTSVDMGVLRKLLALLAKEGIAFPPAIAGVFHALVTLDGTLRTLAPGFDMAAESQDLASRLAGAELVPKSLREATERDLLSILPMLQRPPRRVDRITDALASGRLTTNLRLFTDPHEASFVTSLVNRAVLGLLGSALGVMSVVLLLAPGSPVLAKGLTLLELFGYIGLFISTTLIFRVVLDIVNPRRSR